MKNFITIVGLLYSLNVNTVYAQQQVDAVVDWAQRVDLTIPVDGIVKKVSVNTGQIVKKGELLVELDSRVFNANKRQAKAKVNGLKAAYDEMKRELDRANELYDRTVLSQHDLQVAINNEIIAKSDLEKAKSDFVKAQVDLEYASLVAPFDGLILKRNVEEGLAIINRDSYQTLITMASSQSYLAKAELTPAQSDLAHIGQEVKVVAADKTYSAIVVAVEYTVEKSAGELILVVKFASPNKKLHAGSKVKVVF